MKILIIFTGGTIGSMVDEDGYFAPMDPKKYTLLKLFEEKNPDITKLVSFETVCPYLTLSEQLNGEHLQLLTSCIRSHMDKYDGIIVTHGTDTLQYTAAALSMAFGLCQTPIVLVSANYILTDAKSNGPANFAGAVLFLLQQELDLQMKGPVTDYPDTPPSPKGVFVSYQNYSTSHPHITYNDTVLLHRASRLDYHAPFDDRLFSIDDQIYGQISLLTKTFTKNEYYVEKEDKREVLSSFWTEASPVQWLNAYPGLDWSAVPIYGQAILINTYHSGTLNTNNPSFVDFVIRADGNDCPVFLTGCIPQACYESTKAYNNLPLCLLPKISPITAYIKLSMAISEKTFSKNEIMTILSASLGGDLLEE